MIHLKPVTLEGHGVRLEPLAESHRDGLAAAAADGRLWELWYTSVPEPDRTAAYIADAIAGQAAGHMLEYSRSRKNKGYYVKGQPALSPELTRMVKASIAEVDQRQIDIYRRLSAADRTMGCTATPRHSMQHRAMSAVMTTTARSA